PTNDGQCRVLGQVKPDNRIELWSSVLDSKKKPTAALIRQTAIEKGYLKPPKNADAGSLENEDLNVKMHQVLGVVRGLLQDLPHNQHQDFVQELQRLIDGRDEDEDEAIKEND